jgi:hypothetical protein
LMSKRDTAFCVFILGFALLGALSLGGQVAASLVPLQTFVSTTVTGTVSTISSISVTSTTTSTSSSTTSTTTSSTSSFTTYTSTLTSSTTILSTFIQATTTYTWTITSGTITTITQTFGLSITQAITSLAVLTSTEGVALPIGIPGFPAEAILVGLLVGLMGMILRRRQARKTETQ